MNKNYKTYLTSAAVFIGTSLMAQTAITVTQSDLPTIGSSWINAGDTAATSLTITPASSSFQAWNYASSFTVSGYDTTILVSPNGLQGASNFPQANMAINNPKDSMAIFIKSDNTGLYMDGYYSYSTQNPYNVIDMNPNDLFIPVPFTYNSSRTNTAKYTITFTSGSIPLKMVAYATKLFTADAFGSLVTPVATYPNTLRLKTYQTTLDSMFANFGSGYQFVSKSGDTTTTYTWLRNTSTPIVMEIYLDATNNIVEGSYLFQNNVGIQQQALVSNGLTVYPNPAKDQITIIARGLEAGRSVLSVYDNLGNLVMQNQVETNMTSSTFVLPIAHLAQGVYSYQLNNNAKSLSGKFVKQ